MKKDEQSCPECSEIIKISARLCKHCGTQFSASDVESRLKEREVDNAKRALARKLKKLDEIILEVMACDVVSELNGEEFRPHQIDEMVSEARSSISDVKSRCIFHGMTFVDKPKERYVSDCTYNILEEIDSDIHSAAVDGLVSFEDLVSISDRHNVIGLQNRIPELGLSFIDNAGERVDPALARERAEASMARRAAARKAAMGGTGSPASGHQSMPLAGTVGIGCGALLVGIPIAWLLYVLISMVFFPTKTREQQLCERTFSKCDSSGRSEAAKELQRMLD